MSGWPNGAISELAATSGIDLVPITGPEAEGLVKTYSFFASDEIPDGAYKNVAGVKTVSVNAIWATSVKQPEALIYAITAALWNSNTRKLLDSGHAKGKVIRLETSQAGAGHSAASGRREVLQGKGPDQVRAAPKKIRTRSEMRLKGKTCVVTAAGQGIGAATARAFAREGARVWATDVDAGKLEALAGVDGITTRKLDVLDKEAIGQLAAETGAVDVLFNCAGFVHHGTVLDATDEQWQFAFNLNVRSMFWTIQAFLPGMLEQGLRLDRQHVVGRLLGEGRGAAFHLRHDQGRCCRPHQVGGRRLCVQGHSLQRDLSRHGPDAVARRAHLRRWAAARDAQQFFLQRQPTGRFGAAEEIAALATYLASDESAFTTGTVNVIDGGWSV